VIMQFTQLLAALVSLESWVDWLTSFPVLAILLFFFTIHVCIKWKEEIALRKEYEHLGKSNSKSSRRMHSLFWSACYGASEPSKNLLMILNNKKRYEEGLFGRTFSAIARMVIRPRVTAPWWGKRRIIDVHYVKRSEAFNSTASYFDRSVWKAYTTIEQQWADWIHAEVDVRRPDEYLIERTDWGDVLLIVDSEDMAKHRLVKQAIRTALDLGYTRVGIHNGDKEIAEACRELRVDHEELSMITNQHLLSWFVRCVRSPWDNTPVKEEDEDAQEERLDDMERGMILKDRVKRKMRKNVKSKIAVSIQKVKDVQEKVRKVEEILSNTTNNVEAPWSEIEKKIKSRPPQ